MTQWHIITCEYPPQIGGVSDYTGLLAAELRQAGDAVELWAPRFQAAEPEHVHRALGDFHTADLRRTSDALDQFPSPRTLLLQYVPHGYGKRGINLGFCRWIASRARRGDRIHLMVHEPYLEPRQSSPKLRLVSLLQRRMIRTLLHASQRVFISIPAWENYLRRYAPPVTTFEWLPIPATVPVQPNAAASAEIRARFAHDAVVVGHLGTYSAEMAHILPPALLQLLRNPPKSVALLLGNNGDTFAATLKSVAPDLRDRIHAPGHLSDAALSHHLAACDLFLQPYPDGLSSRRTSLMNVLSHGVAVVSNTGHLTEAMWHDSAAVALTTASEPGQLAAVGSELLRDPASRAAFAAAGLALYRSRFDWPNVIAALRSSPDAANPRLASTTSNR